MPLIKCPDCGKSVSDAAPSCIGCGRPMQQNKVAAEVHPVPSDRDDDARPIICPNCHGATVRRFSVLYDEGRTTARTYTKGSAIGVSQGGVGVGFGLAESLG